MYLVVATAVNLGSGPGACETYRKVDQLDRMAKLVNSGPVAVTKEGGKANLEKTVKSGSLVALFVCAMLLVVLS